MQGRLNLAIKDMVKEIIKRLDVEIIFAIFYSEYVSPVQVDPKKVGLIVVKNEKWKDVSMHTQIGW